MAAGLSLGEGIGLKRGNRSDIWMRQLAADMKTKEAAAEKKKEKDEAALATLMDFKIDHSKYLPAWSKEIANVEAGMINDIAEIRQRGGTMAEQRLRVLKAKDQLSSYVQGNNAAMDYIKNQEVMKDPNVVARMTSSNSTLSELSQYSNPAFFNIGNDGSFSYTAVPSKTTPFKFEQFDVTGVPTGERTSSGGKTYEKFQSSFTPESIQREANKRYSDRDYQMQMAFKLSMIDPQYKFNPEKETLEQWSARIADPLREMTIADIESQRPTAKYEWKDVTPKKTGGDGEGKDKRKDFGFTVADVTVPSATGGSSYVAKRLVQAVYSPQAVTMQSVPGMVDADKQVLLNTSKSFSFKPSAIIVQKGKNGKYQKYILGDVVQEAAGGQGIIETVFETQDGKNQTVKKIMIPYGSSGIESFIDKNNNTEEFDSVYDQLRGGSLDINSLTGGARSVKSGSVDDIFGKK